MRSDFLRAFITVLLTIVCVAILFLGNNHWKEKTDIKADVSSSDKIIIETPVSDEKTENTQDELDGVTGEGEESEEADEATENEQLLQLTANWPEESQQQFAKALEEEKPFQLAIVGSKIATKGKVNWPALMKEKISAAYGDKVIVDILTYDLTTESFVEEGKVKEIMKQKPALVLFEPFTLNDNGVVDRSDSNKFIEEIVNEMEKKGATVVLQPPHPLANASLYPKQVETLKKFAKAQKITFLDHWSAWPEQDAEEFKKHVKTEDDRTYPSKAGHEVWAKYLTEYFVAE